MAFILPEDFVKMGLSRMKCPGQDRGFWQGNPVVEVPCPVCGWSVEVFRDEAKGRCTHCGHRFPNPGGNFGCAQWCPMAKECLGFAPERPQPAAQTEGAVAARLINRLETALSGQPERLGRTLRAYRHAREMVGRTGGNPQIVLVATLLASASGNAPGSEGPAGPADPGASPWRTWLAELRLSPAATEQIQAIVEALHAGTTLDCPEYRIVRAACVRADRPENGQAESDAPAPPQPSAAASPAAGQPPVEPRAALPHPRSAPAESEAL